ncbi:MAG: DUF433 domain-containing protein [Actinobacteria bacterium]|nr:DUF433 domain-containing protein [Actinomycetota bacterium]
MATASPLPLWRPKTGSACGRRGVVRLTGAGSVISTTRLGALSGPALIRRRRRTNGSTAQIDGCPNILQLLAGGMTVDEVLADYADLDLDDVLAAFGYAALTVGGQRIPLARS